MHGGYYSLCRNGIVHTAAALKAAFYAPRMPETALTVPFHRSNNHIKPYPAPANAALKD